ncbi:SDR family oxidoreductase [Streptomyces sp. NPDC046939]|uniref:SDR family oxidoreductase n=1 Tax=Streptomyces sp. NPDC046939 TaxID=3155376 RepID=UPI0033E3BA06
MDYAASKAAQIIFTKSIAAHLAKRGVRANVIAPGPIWTVLNVAGQRRRTPTPATRSARSSPSPAA